MKRKTAIELACLSILVLGNFFAWVPRGMGWSAALLSLACVCGLLMVIVVKTAEAEEQKGTGKKPLRVRIYSDEFEHVRPGYFSVGHDVKKF